VLVVDDDNGQRTVLKTMLSKKGYQVDTAEDGDHAVKAAQNLSYDLILMDGCMPNKTGSEATKEIRANEAAKGLEVEGRSPFHFPLAQTISNNVYQVVDNYSQYAKFGFQMYNYRSYRHLVKRVRCQVFGGGHV
jgi:CheY-like chemotaxis protein